MIAVGRPGGSAAWETYAGQTARHPTRNRTSYDAAVTGLLVGWRIRTSVLEALAAFGLLLLFAYAISWLMALVGLSVKSPEVVQNASFIIIFPLTFIANTFVPTDNFPPALKAFADWNPVSSVTLAARELFGNTSPALPPPDVWPAEHPVVYSLVWIVDPGDLRAVVGAQVRIRRRPVVADPSWLVDAVGRTGGPEVHSGSVVPAGRDRHDPHAPPVRSDPVQAASGEDVQLRSLASQK